MYLNSLKNRLYQDQLVFGTWNTLNSPRLTEIIANTGLDFQIIDYEHGPFDLSSAHHHVSACLASSTDCAPIFRTPIVSDWMSLQLLDQGAHGLVFPHIHSVSQIQEIHSITQFPPIGNRGYSPFTSPFGFSPSHTPDKLIDLDRSLLRIALIESISAIDILPSILDYNLIDVFYFGAYDLSVELGFPGDVFNTQLLRIVSDAVKIVRQSGRYAGGFIPKTVAQVQSLSDIGLTFFTCNVDSMILHDSYSSLVSSLNSIR